MRSPTSEMNTDLKKGTWSLEEDQKLISYINKYGIWNWSQMPRFAGLSRSGKSCRLRWMNYLKPNVKKGKFSKEEVEIILLTQSLLGNRWSAIASRLPGRSDNDVKNYWHSHLKKRVSEQILVCETTEQHDINSSQTSETEKVENIQESANHMNDFFESHFTFEEDNFSLSFNSSTNDQHTQFRANYYDTGSPGTIDDLQCFWNQLFPFENLELRNNDMDYAISAPDFEDSNDHPLSSNSFYNNDHSSNILPELS